MRHSKPLATAIALVCFTASLPAAAQIGPPTQTRSTTQVIPPPPPPPPPPRQVEPARSVPPPAMPTSLSQRQQAAPVQAPQKPVTSSKQGDDNTQRIGATPAKVYDRNGRELHGMEQAGANRVRDSRTGRYYDTVPMGDGQRIKP